MIEAFTRLTKTGQAKASLPRLASSPPSTSSKRNSPKPVCSNADDDIIITRSLHGRFPDSVIVLRVCVCACVCVLVLVSANNTQAMTKQKSKSTKKHTKKSNKPSATSELPPSWVDDLDWLPVGEEGDTDGTDSASATDSHDISILSWNVLADAYCTFRSHPHLPLKFQRHVFDRPQRQHHVRRTLKRLAPMADLMALQEVDSPLEVEGCMQELGYEGLQTPTSAGGNSGRVDSCALYWNPQHYSCLEHEIVRLDDIAIMCTKSGETIEDATSLTTMTNMAGVQSSFCRKNMGLLVRLQHQPSKREIVVAVVHLFWNPIFEYVKVRFIRSCPWSFWYDGWSGKYFLAYPRLFLPYTSMIIISSVVSSALCLDSSQGVLPRRHPLYPMWRF
jgi:hypothetical protein